MSGKLFTALMVCLGTLLCSVAMAQEVDNNRDPLEGVNRAVYRFNAELDRIVFKPVAEQYAHYLPEPARNCVGNVFGNAADVGTAVNNLLQGKLADALSDVCRIAINSTIGIFGCFDFASDMGFIKHKEDFGQTLAVWGVGTGPYLMLPFLGPSTLRDSIGLFGVDTRLDAVRQMDHIPTRNEALGLRVIDQRANLLNASNLIENAALDPYVFLRDAYFQRRNSQVYDGEPPDRNDQGVKDKPQGAIDPVQDEFYRVNAN